MEKNVVTDNLSSEVLEEKLVQVNRVAKVVKGGRGFGFRYYVFQEGQHFRVGG